MKFMNKKRFGAVVMAGALALSLTVPAFAGSANPDPYSTTIEGGYQAPVISVVVPTTGTAHINPFGLPVSVPKSDETTVQLVDQQITSLPLSLKNMGTVPMDVNASLTVTPKGDAIIKNADLTSNEKGKEINVTLEVAGLNDDALKVAADDETLEDKLVDKFAADATWASLTTANKLSAKDCGKGATGTAAKSAAAMATLGAATVADDTVTYGPKSIALFRLTGKVNTEPNDGQTTPTDTPWAAADGFTAKIVFSFKPAQKLAITAGSHSGTLSNVSIPAKAYEGETVTFTFTAASGKACTGALTTASSVAVTINEEGTTGKYTGTFVMPAAADTLTITVPA